MTPPRAASALVERDADVKRSAELEGLRASAAGGQKRSAADVTRWTR
jgi:hypothetical protein